MNVHFLLGWAQIPWRENKNDEQFHSITIGLKFQTYVYTFFVFVFFVVVFLYFALLIVWCSYWIFIILFLLLL